MSDPVARAESIASRVAERAAAADAGAAFPGADVGDLRGAGLLGLMVPTELGGLGVGFAGYVKVAMALARANPAIALLFNMHAAVTGSLAAITEELAAALGASDAFFQLRTEILTAAASGSMYGVAISEARAGARLSRLDSTYTNQDGGYRLRGRKVTCSGAGHLDGYLVAARSTHTSSPTVSYFFLPPGPGVEACGTWDPLGMRATASRGLDIDVVVPSRNLLGGVEGLGLLLAYSMPQWLVASYAAVYVGVAQAAVEAASAALAERRIRGAEVTPAMRSRVGRADAATAATTLVVEHAARLVDTGPGTPETNAWVYRAKLLAGDTAMQVTADVIEACGLSVLQRGSPLERLYRDGRLGSLMPPRSDICADVLGAARIGMDANELEAPPW
jgi:alkylation response protein AidB-like acyl-CoA dehydrogenase